MDQPQFLMATVVLPVHDIYDTNAWYERALGFETLYVHGKGRRGEGEDFANYSIMRRDAVHVHFILDEGGPIWTRSGTGYLYLNVRDVDAVYADVKSRGIPIARELQRENWPARGFNLRDPSGNNIHIGTDHLTASGCSGKLGLAATFPQSATV
jgi:uncharacterized glyoxalase superfamily protein PhnB